MVRQISLLFLLLGIAACSRNSHKDPEHRYPLTGKIVALDAQHQVATVDAAAIPNFMEAMTMDYPIQSAADFGSLHVGDKIAATVNVDADEKYDLSNIKVQASGK